MIFLAVLVLGAVSLTRIAVDLLPDITFPIVAVYTDYKGAGPAEVERMITEPIEKTVGTVNNVKEVGSYSNEGTSLVIIEFNWGTNMDLAANDVRESLSFISDIMPEDANEPMVIKFDPSMMPIMMLRVSGDIDPARLKQITDDDIIYKIEQVEGVAAAYSEGGVEREIQVELDRAKLQATGISPDQIKGVLAMENLNLPGGYVKRGNKEFILRTVGEFRDIAQIENVILTSRGGVPVYLKDVARVKDGFKKKGVKYG